MFGPVRKPAGTRSKIRFRNTLSLQSSDDAATRMGILTILRLEQKRIPLWKQNELSRWHVLAYVTAGSHFIAFVTGEPGPMVESFSASVAKHRERS